MNVNMHDVQDETDLQPLTASNTNTGTCGCVAQYDEACKGGEGAERPQAVEALAQAHAEGQAEEQRRMECSERCSAEEAKR